MSATLQGLATTVRAPERLGMTEQQYREACDALADQVSAGDVASAPHQREADLEEAEWMLGIIYAAGFTVTRAVA